VRVAGVVNAEFASGDLPSIHSALLIQRDGEAVQAIMCLPTT
jgi:hypothetical protein